MLDNLAQVRLLSIISSYDKNQGVFKTASLGWRSLRKLGCARGAGPVAPGGPSALPSPPPRPSCGRLAPVCSDGPHSVWRCLPVLGWSPWKSWTASSCWGNPASTWRRPRWKRSCSTRPRPALPADRPVNHRTSAKPPKVGVALCSSPLWTVT